MNADTSRPAGHRPSPVRDFALRLTATPRGARLARRLAAEQLAEWGLPYDGETNRTVALLVAELAANAVRHGQVRGRDFRLRITLRAEGVVRVEVTDARVDRLPPAPGTLRPPSDEGEAGRGLLLVESLATRWGTCRDDPYTKTVWCEVSPVGGRCQNVRSPGDAGHFRWSGWGA